MTNAFISMFYLHETMQTRSLLLFVLLDIFFKSRMIYVKTRCSGKCTLQHVQCKIVDIKDKMSIRAGNYRYLISHTSAQYLYIFLEPHSKRVIVDFNYFPMFRKCRYDGINLKRVPRITTMSNIDIRISAM